MTRLLAAGLLAVAAFAAAVPASAAPDLPKPGGTCEGSVDVLCRRPCGVDELDCGMIPPCVVYLNGGCWY